MSAEVARRTVTKYRKAMKIPSSRQRRDWKLTRAAQPAEPGPVIAGDDPDGEGEADSLDGSEI